VALAQFPLCPFGREAWALKIAFCTLFASQAKMPLLTCHTTPPEVGLVAEIKFPEVNWGEPCVDMVSLGEMKPPVAASKPTARRWIAELAP